MRLRDGAFYDPAAVPPAADPASRVPSVTHSVLALHHGYREPGGEEQAAITLAELAESHLGESVAWLRRDSTELTAGDAARGLVAGGLGSTQVSDAIERTGATLLHAHNLFPTFGPLALQAARDAGAAVVVQLHNTRLVCAVATNVRNGRDCTKCHGSWAVPGIIHRCRGSVPESVAYGTALPRWRREVVQLADVVIVPSVAARSRMQQLGLGVPADQVHVVGGVAPEIASSSTASSGRFALIAGRLAPEKDVATAISACSAVGIPLVIAGAGPELERLQAHAAKYRVARAANARDILGEDLLLELPEAPEVRGSTAFVGRVDQRTLAALRANAAIALMPSLAHETFGLAALESMAAALPTIGSRVGALPEVLGEDAVVPPRNAPAMAAAIRRVIGNDDAGLAAAARAREIASPDVVARRLSTAYDAAREQRILRREYDVYGENSL